MRRKHLYLAFCVIGVALPYWQFIPWFLDHGMNVPLFVHHLFQNRISGFFAMDLIVTAVVFISFARAEGARLRIHYWWLTVIATLAVGVSFGFPLFLYMRERAGEASAPGSEATIETGRHA